MYFLEKYLPYKALIFIATFLCVTNVFTVVYFLNTNEQEPCICEDCSIVSSEAEETQEIEKIKVDIKGYVKKPGVYELDSGTIINDLIKLAGGLKTNGTTDNINLSKKLNNEDMIVVLSKSELKKQSTVTSSTNTKTSSSTNSNLSDSSTTLETTNKKISLNTATKEELMTLSGIGEAKADSIIEYRLKTPFQDITEIMNISGIGESVYEKIKDNITV